MLKSTALAITLFCACTGPAMAYAPDETPIVIGRSTLLESKVLGQLRRINVHTPADYATSGKTYPVLFLLDGGEREDFPHIAGLAQLGELSWTYREMIVVGIEGIDRRHDLTHPSTVAQEQADFPTLGGSAAYRRFLSEELKPWVAARYRTNGESAIMGESLTIGDEGSTMQEGVDKVMAAIGAAKPAGLTLVYDPMPHEQHSTIYHPAALKAFRTVWPGPRPD